MVFRSLRLLLLSLVVLMTPSCSTVSQSDYRKHGATDLDWERDSSECQRGASASFFDRCLELRGWRKK